jgi:hypothetical protein
MIKPFPTLALMLYYSKLSALSECFVKVVQKQGIPAFNQYKIRLFNPGRSRMVTFCPSISINP